jgi:hypothetical protein
VSPATASTTNVTTDSGASLGEGREITIASPGSPFDRMRGRIETVTAFGLVFVTIPGKGFLQLRPDEVVVNPAAAS